MEERETLVEDKIASRRVSPGRFAVRLAASQNWHPFSGAMPAPQAESRAMSKLVERLKPLLTRSKTDVPVGEEAASVASSASCEERRSRRFPSEVPPVKKGKWEMIAWEQGEGMLRRTTVEDKAVQTEPGMFSPSADGGTADADRHGAQGPPTVAPRRLIPRPPTVAPPTPTVAVSTPIGMGPMVPRSKFRTPRPPTVAPWTPIGTAPKAAPSGAEWLRRGFDEDMGRNGDARGS